MRILLFIAVNLVFLVHTQESLRRAEERLRDHIFKNYSKTHRPTVNESKPLIVKVGFELIHIMSVDELMQRISIKTWFRLIWTNELLRWDPKKWEGIKRLKVDPNEVWVPDVLLYNQVDGILSSDNHDSKLLVVLDSNGDSYWVRPEIFTTPC